VLRGQCCIRSQCYHNQLWRLYCQSSIRSQPRTETEGWPFFAQYFRVILDEAHHIKNRMAKSSRACYEIEAEHRWVLTGTPIVNRLEDSSVWSVSYGLSQWNNFSFWKLSLRSHSSPKTLCEPLDVVQTVLEPLVLRRTKDMKTPTGEALVPLPPKRSILWISSSQKNGREFYDYIFTRAKRTFCSKRRSWHRPESYTQQSSHKFFDSGSHAAIPYDPTRVLLRMRRKQLKSQMQRVDLQIYGSKSLMKFTATTDVEGQRMPLRPRSEHRDEETNECPICSEEPMIEQTVTDVGIACKKCLLTTSLIERE